MKNVSKSKLSVEEGIKKSQLQDGGKVIESDSKEKTDIPAKQKTSKKRVTFIRRISLKPLILFSLAGAILLILLLHGTYFSVYADPLGDYYDRQKISEASQGVDRAQAMITIVERLTDDLQDIQSKSLFRNRSSALTTKIVSYDERIAAEMDFAKNNGADIKALAKRFCDSLEKQHKILIESYGGEIAAEKVYELYGDVEAIEEALESIDANIDDAMHWVQE